MSLKLSVSYCLFYARVLLVVLVVFPCRLVFILLPGKLRVKAEAWLIRACNHLFRLMVPFEPFLDRDKFYQWLDVADFRTLCRRMGIRDDWYHGLRILDVGCGHGKLSRKLALEGAREVDGIDIAASSIAYANNLLAVQPVNNLRLHLQSVYELDFPENHFDAVVSQVVFEHIDDVPRALAQIYRVLKPGGYFYFTVDAFRSRYGPHMAHFVRVPWPLVFFSEEACTKVCCDGFERLRRKHPAVEIPDYFQWSMSLPSLNRIRIRDFEAMIKQAGFETKAVTRFADEKPLLALLPDTNALSEVREYLRGSAAYYLIKPNSSPVIN